MKDQERLNQLELLLAELVHSNELSEMKIQQNEQMIRQNEKRIGSIEKFYSIVSVIMVLTGGGTLFAILKLLELF